MKNGVLVTGALGGIGRAICSCLSSNGYSVIGTDIKAKENIPNCRFTLEMDLLQLVGDSLYRNQKMNELNKLPVEIVGLVNNAATQLLNRFEDIREDWLETISVNLTAPMLLSQQLLPVLERNSGSIVNIASIHHVLTKPRFVSYATSKSALIGLTKSMAVDLQGRVRVNAISPAAILTDMLKAGFDYDDTALDQLKGLHPTKTIGYPEEVARLVLLLLGNESKFINGANLQLDGGISSVLNDL